MTLSLRLACHLSDNRPIKTHINQHKMQGHPIPKTLEKYSLITLTCQIK